VLKPEEKQKKFNTFGLMQPEWKAFVLENFE
jgi:hypothetical protein